MKFSIVVPQVFYDLIARVLPGFFFFVFLFFNLPGLGRNLYLGPGGSNFVDSLGVVLGYAAICYFVGWLFSSLTWGSKRKEVRERHIKEGEKKPSEMYQRIRIAHPAAGFRIVKLRAEARMIETIRTAITAILIITVVYLGVILVIGLGSSYAVRNVMWVRSFIGLFIACVSFYGFRKREEKAWKNYYGNIDKVYEILKEYVDPVKLFPQ